MCECVKNVETVWKKTKIDKKNMGICWLFLMCLGPFLVPHFSRCIYLFAFVVAGGGGVIYLFIYFSVPFSYFPKCHSTCDKCIIILFCVSSLLVNIV